jgi:hypothetical protein
MRFDISETSSTAKPEGTLDVYLLSLAIFIFIVIVASAVVFALWLINKFISFIPYIFINYSLVISVVLFIYLFANFFLGRVFAPFGMSEGRVFYLLLGAAVAVLSLVLMLTFGWQNSLIFSLMISPAFSIAGIIDNRRLFARFQVNGC